MGPHQLNVGRVLVDRDHVTIHALLKHNGAPTDADVFTYQRVIGVHGYITNVVGLGMTGHLQAKLIIRVQNSRIRRDFNNDAFYARKIFDGFDTL